MTTDIKPSGLSRDSIQRFAQMSAVAWNFDYSDDPAFLISRLGGKITTQHAFKFSDGSVFALDAKADLSFTVNLLDHVLPTRHRFDSAVAIGHLILHQRFVGRQNGAITDLQVSRYVGGRAAIESIWFASEL